jgi:predicted flap endonuclease-1-like 5' DNA nuclease
LVIIEGIGPKIAGLLKAAGILTFAQLAATDVPRLKQILAEANLTALADPSTWSEQAGLAAEGKWDDLQQLQSQLKRGQRK